MGLLRYLSLIAGLMPILDSRFKATAEMEMSKIKVSDLETPLEEGTETDAITAEPCQCDKKSSLMFC